MSIKCRWLSATIKKEPRVNSAKKDIINLVWTGFQQTRSYQSLGTWGFRNNCQCWIVTNTVEMQTSLIQHTHGHCCDLEQIFWLWITQSFDSNWKEHTSGGVRCPSVSSFPPLIPQHYEPNGPLCNRLMGGEFVMSTAWHVCLDNVNQFCLSTAMDTCIKSNREIVINSSLKTIKQSCKCLKSEYDLCFTVL